MENESIAPAPSRARLVLRDIVKSYGSNDVLKGINLTVEAGRVHALLGANGAGKSTLLSCLSGATRPDAGEIIISGHSYTGFTPRSAFEAGTAIIYQHFQLIGSLSVSDNVFLGSEATGPIGLLRRSTQERRTKELLDSLDVHIDPAALVETLSVGEQQIVEIVRALRREPKVLILDEPTAALGTHEVEALLALVRRLAHDQGIAVIYVTHLLREVMVIADTVTVLRDGAVFLNEAGSDVTMERLVQAISPDSTVDDLRTERAVGDELLVLDAYRCSYTGPVSLSVREGEIVGVFGLLGSGRTDLLETLAGVKKPISGAVRLGGSVPDLSSPTSAIGEGISLVASDRTAQSLFGELTAMENVLMPHFDELSRVIRRPAAESAAFGRIALEVGLTPNRPAQEADRFSGGNAQKLAVGRWASSLGRTRVLLLDEPTQGVDIGARHDLYDLLRQFAVRPGRAVVFSSSDADEIVALADRVVILVDGAVTDILSPRIGEEALLSLAHGATTTTRDPS
jgi:ribose transport system ATP-binding protein